MVGEDVSLTLFLVLETLFLLLDFFVQHPFEDLGLVLLYLNGEWIWERGDMGYPRRRGNFGQDVFFLREESIFKNKRNSWHRISWVALHPQELFGFYLHGPTAFFYRLPYPTFV